MEERPLYFVGSSRKDIREFPEEVKEYIGYALYEAQKGKKPLQAKPLKGFGGSVVLEIVEDHFSDTYRAVYTVRFKEAVYVLHCFQKKSKHGIKTPVKDMELVKTRLKAAEAHHRYYFERGECHEEE